VQGVPERAAAPEAEGWCAAFDASGVRAKHCVPWSSKTHVYDVGSRGWALGFLEEHARNAAARRVIIGLRRKMVGKAVGGRPSFSEALAWLAARASGIKEGLCCSDCPGPRVLPIFHDIPLARGPLILLR